MVVCGAGQVVSRTDYRFDRNSRSWHACTVGGVRKKGSEDEQLYTAASIELNRLGRWVEPYPKSYAHYHGTS